jgi:arylsulfatase A-like enzyme
MARTKTAVAPSPALHQQLAQVSNRTLVGWAIWFALLTGLLETLILAAQRHIGGQLIFRSSHYWWMPTAGALITFLIVAGVLAGLARAVSRLRTPTVYVSIFVWLLSFNTLLVPRWLHAGAAAVLCTGIAFKLGPVLAASQRVRSITRRTLPALASYAALATLLSFAIPALREDRAKAALPKAPNGARNIVFVILDTVRSRSLSLYGYVRPTTPRVADFARTGVTFERAIAPSPWTLPTHASFFTGVSPQQHAAVDPLRPLDKRFRTLAEELSSRGYASAGFIGNLAYGTTEFGLARGFHHWEDYRIGVGEVFTNFSISRWLLLQGYAGNRNSGLARILGIDHWVGRTRRAENISSRALRWIEAQEPTRPFFLFANYFDAHAPYLPPQPHLGSFGPIPENGLKRRWRRERDRNGWRARGNARVEQNLLNRYEESIAHTDEEVGRLLAELERRGYLENTVVIIASDHGEGFGEHGFFEHSTSVYFEQVHVPLIISAPAGVPRGARVRSAVTLQDLPATAMHLAVGESGAMPGQSLAHSWGDRIVGGKSPVTATLDTDGKSQASIVNDRYHYIKYGDGTEHLYDHTKDPLEEHDLAASASSEILNDLRERLRAAVAAH